MTTDYFTPQQKRIAERFLDLLEAQGIVRSTDMPDVDADEFDAIAQAVADALGRWRLH